MPSAGNGVSTYPARRAARMSYLLDASILVALLAASSAPTPLYPIYQEQWDLSALTVTMVFSAYALALLLALLTTGALSDYVGRRPVLAGALAAEATSMVLFAQADGPGSLTAARILQGMATGAATAAAGAALLDLEEGRKHPGRAALTNSVAPVAGMAAGVLVATVLIRFVPGPTITVFLLLALLFLVQSVAVLFSAETVRRHQGALHSLRPRVSLPGPARHALLVSGAGVTAVWALGGYYSSLGPALVRLVAPDAPRAAGGMIFFTVSAAAALTVWAAGRLRPVTAALVGGSAVVPAVTLTLTGMYAGSVALVFAGAILAGVAFGAVSQGAVRMTLAPVSAKDRAATLAAYYVLSYLSMSIPAIAAGAATTLYGLTTAVLLYGLAVAALSVAAVTALSLSRKTPCTADSDARPRTAATPVPWCGTRRRYKATVLVASSTSGCDQHFHNRPSAFSGAGVGCERGGEVAQMP
ncbi:MFS transporter [Streptomyces cupreus]|uniref:MFS transporter n=1 Tax=Streptomyces cupreus TaxID=2759956 RepID=A0A7X1J7P1_9ACTN|nr:MFS transporter [Streptomyces cupreus]MBC2904682.1 MFS transporter [Streptomyces cupreus]